jgi:hypothetical protein
MSREHARQVSRSTNLPKKGSWAQVAAGQVILQRPFRDANLSRRQTVQGIEGHQDVDTRAAEIQDLEDELLALTTELERMKVANKERQCAHGKLTEASSQLAERERTIRSREYELDEISTTEAEWCAEFLALTKHIADGGSVEDISSVIVVDEWDMPGW